MARVERRIEDGTEVEVLVGGFEDIFPFYEFTVMRAKTRFRSDGGFFPLLSRPLGSMDLTLVVKPSSQVKSFLEAREMALPDCGFTLVRRPQSGPYQILIVVDYDRESPIHAVCELLVPLPPLVVSMLDPSSSITLESLNEGGWPYVLKAV